MESLLESLIPFFAIAAVFGLPFLIAVMIIRFLRERMHAKMQMTTGINLKQRLEEYEQRQEQLIKRVQNLETIVVDADLGNPRLKEARRDPDFPEKREQREPDRPLKNKLRS
ncbi:hypothetical protein QA596_05320 [Balneolales bacterium ANBcel1]|nr:hypothetical protein [Balneolales bacterium ANBcel1]